MSNPSNNNKNKMNMPKFNLNWAYIVIIVLLAYLFWQGKSSNGSYHKEVPYSEFQTYVINGYASSITVNKGDGNVQMFIKKEHVGKIFGGAAKAGNEPSVSAEFPSVDNVDKFLSEQKEAKHFTGKIQYEANKDLLGGLLMNLLFPVLFFVGIWFLFMRQMGGGGNGGGGGGIFSVGKSKAQLYEKSQGTHVTFKDVAGQDEAKQEVMEIVKFLKDPHKYTELGGKIPKGALLVGPPGTGKTLLAKAVAGEANVPFFSISGSDFVEMFVGVGASRVRDLFRQAKEKAPCIVFIDEIDAVGRARGRNPSMGGNDERENTLNQLLTEMDGFGTNSGIIVLVATNRADILDKALLRAGRFDRQIHVELPGLPERKQIFKVHMKPLKIDDSVDIDLLSRQTPGFSGADIANVCNEAALIAARKNHNAVGKQDFLDAIDRIIGGLEKKTKVMTQDEKRTIALHEAGHATVSWFLQYANPLVKVTIVPRGQALGAAWYLPEERTITTKEQMLDEICATLGGRAAEEIAFGEITTGASNDIEQATRLARAMITRYGMSEEFDMVAMETVTNQYLGGDTSISCSAETQKDIDKKVVEIIKAQHEKARKLLRDNRARLDELASYLYEKETITGTEFMDILEGKKATA